MKPTVTMTSHAPRVHPSKPARIEDQLFINGEFVPSISGKRFDIYDPSSETASASVYEAGPEDVDAAVDAAEAAFPPWSELSAITRGDWIFKLANAVEKALPEISYLDAISMGKPAGGDCVFPFVPKSNKISSILTCT